MMDASTLSTLAAVIFNEATGGERGPFALLPTDEKATWFRAARSAVVYVTNGAAREGLAAVDRALSELIPDTWGGE
jgi:hypothetical protein